MKKTKRLLRKARPYFPRLAKFFKALEMGFAKRSFLQQSGFMRTVINGSAVDADGNAIPWFNYAVIDILTERLPRDAVIFEYGAGASTEFFSEKVAEVFSVENSKDWAEFVNERAGNNTKVFDVKPDDIVGYVEAIRKPERQFDLILVDGLYRIECLKEAFSRLTSRGIIIVDDLNDEEFWHTVYSQGGPDFKHLSFHGLKPGSPRKLTTTILYRPGNCLNI